MPVLIIVLGAVFVLLAGCGRQSSNTPARAPVTEKKAEQLKPVKPVEESGPKFAVHGEKPTLNWVENGSLRMRATAQELKGDEINKIAVAKDFSGEMYENGKISTMMTAPKVVADTPKRIVTACDGVILKSLDRKTVVSAKWIRWFAREQKVIGVGDVKITSEMGNMTGAAFEADTALKTLKVKDSAKGLDIK
ncbi:MAG: hypothetical protein NT018_01330 [Armatimonadetes bacterium]|nr:hypothetical protein [Armatimonadota bacterium]